MKKDDATTSIRREEKTINSLGLHVGNCRLWSSLELYAGGEFAFLLLPLRRSFNFLVPTEICTSLYRKEGRKG